MIDKSFDDHSSNFKPLSCLLMIILKSTCKSITGTKRCVSLNLNSGFKLEGKLQLQEKNKCYPWKKWNIHPSESQSDFQAKATRAWHYIYRLIGDCFRHKQKNVSFGLSPSKFDVFLVIIKQYSFNDKEN